MTGQQHTIEAIWDEDRGEDGNEPAHGFTATLHEDGEAVETAWFATREELTPLGRGSRSRSARGALNRQ